MADNVANNGWELFTGRAKQVVKHQMVSVQTRGNIAFNKLSYEALGEPEALELLFNPKINSFALRRGDPTLHTSYPVRKQPKSISYIVSAQAFCNQYGIPIDRTRRYIGEFENGMLVVDLTHPVSEPVSRKRNKRKQLDNESSS